MLAKTKLIKIATTCCYAASMKLRSDADTLLKLAEQLDEQSAAIYLDRFCKKWGLDPQGEQSAEEAVSPMLARRAPQTDELESQILAQLEEVRAQREREREIEVYFEGLDASAAPH
jgi:hypothetical protein